MCGIFGYTGTKRAAPILIDGLKTLEYRGYDSAGMFIPRDGAYHAVGIVDNVAKKIPKKLKGSAGIAHTRWATHGAPNQENTHPHSDCTDSIWIVHNGIVENHTHLRKQLIKKGHIFSSDTDSEVIAHLIEEYVKKGTSFKEAFALALCDIQGTYGIAVISKNDPENIFIARMGSPIVLGIGENEYFVASDPSAILKHTKTVIYLMEGECAVITPTSHGIFTTGLETRIRKPEQIEWDIDQVQKSGFEHFMLKEIMEGADVLTNSARGRILFDEGNTKLGGLQDVEVRLREIKKIIIVGCGSAYYAGLCGKLMLEEFSSITTDVEIASEFRYRKIPLDQKTALLAISQSGETADTLACIHEMKQKGLLTLGIVNTVGSTIARETDAGVYNHAGPEIGVASTKAFLSQLEVLLLLALFLGRKRDLSLKEGREIAFEISELPKKIGRILKQRNEIKKIAKRYANHANFLFIGRKYNFPIAYEGALKLKEVSYIHAEGYGAGEMKHGPIAMIDTKFPTVALVPKDSVYEKTISNIEEIKARKGKVIAIATEGDTDIKKLVDEVIYIPRTFEVTSPMLSVVPLHLFAYYMGVARGRNVDRPRNLAKSVTVE